MAVLAERLGVVVELVVALRLCVFTGTVVGMVNGASDGNVVGVGRGESGDKIGKLMLDSIVFNLLELVLPITPPFHSVCSSCAASASVG